VRTDGEVPAARERAVLGVPEAARVVLERQRTGARMISPDRFIVQSRYRDDWLEAREGGVTATMVAQAATPSGFDALVRSWSDPPFEGNAYTDFGSWAERYIIDHAHRELGILPNDWLIRSADDPRWLGTPDGLSLDHTEIAEAKTGSTPPKNLTAASIKREHRDQCQWNLMVTGAQRCRYLVQPRAVASDGSFYLGLWEPIGIWIDRDEERISFLETVAERIMEARNAHRELV
jgi:hypothetical protein